MAGKVVWYHRTVQNPILNRLDIGVRQGASRWHPSSHGWAIRCDFFYQVAFLWTAGVDPKAVGLLHASDGDCIWRRIPLGEILVGCRRRSALRRMATTQGAIVGKNSLDGVPAFMRFFILTPGFNDSGVLASQ